MLGFRMYFSQHNWPTFYVGIASNRVRCLFLKRQNRENMRTIPTDDGDLEMAEIEGLINIRHANSSGSSVGSGLARKFSRRTRLYEWCGKVMDNPRIRKRVTGGSMLILAAILMWIGLQEESVDTTPHMSDVEMKNPAANDNNSFIQTNPPVKENEEESTIEEPDSPDNGDELVEDETPEEKPKSNIPQLDPDPFHGELTDEQHETLTEKWGQWHFWDGDEDRRPKEDYCGKYPNRDIPEDDFPDDAWQVDATYVNHYLNDADLLVTRTMEGIFTEYGHGKPLGPEELTNRHRMFHWDQITFSGEEAKPPPEYANKSGARDTGGWTTKRSDEGLVRRLLHAMITNDQFTIVLGGHSAAAGHGNHFRQSYMMQVERILKPVFDRLNVKLTTRNICQGGMGTVQHSLGAGSILGDSIDLLLWDSGMTENGNPEHIDLFLRQGILSGDRVPVLWASGARAFPLLNMLHEDADADVGEWGLGMAGILETTSEEQMKTLPWATHGLKCPTGEEGAFCRTVPQWKSDCWFDRPDGIKPEKSQRAKMQGRVKWHPPWRNHQLTGRVIAFKVLEALQIAINQWSSGTMGGQPLDGSRWHVTDYYDNIRNKTMALDESKGSCYSINGTLPKRICKTSMKGYTQHTPRANSEETSLTSILKPAPNGYVPKNNKVALYDGPDIGNHNYDIPEGEIDVLSIAMNRRQRRLQTALFTNFTNNSHSQTNNYDATTVRNRAAKRVTRNLDDEIVPGTGWEVINEFQGKCDGEYLSVCARSTDHDCVLSGHHDARGAVIGDAFSGWLVMKVKAVKHGIIVLKIETWHAPNDHPLTNGWTTVNNEGQSPISNEDRSLRVNYDMVDDLPDDFFFDYAINGKITSLGKESFQNSVKKIQRVVETLTVLDDENFQEQDVEVAVRMRGCTDKCTFAVSHLYYA